MISIHRINEDQAQRFWEKVLSGENILRTDPEYRLRAQLIKPVGSVVLHTISGHKMHRSMYNLCACWWNSRRTGETRHSVKLAAISGVIELKP